MMDPVGDPARAARQGTIPRVEELRGLAVGALVSGAAAFLFLVLSFRSLSNDHYMYLAWAQQLVHGALPGRDFVDPGMPLQYILSAAVQALVPGPLSELLFTFGLLALAAGVTYVVVARLTGSALAAALAVAVEVVMQPRLYSYPKVLVPAVAVLLALWYVNRPDTTRIAALAGWTIVAFLFRHDLGVYAGVLTALVLASYPSAWRARLGAVQRYALLTVAFMLPYLAYLQWSEGIATHVLAGIQFFGGESNQLFPELPAFGFWRARSGGGWLPWDADDSVSFLFYLVWAVPFVAGFVALRGSTDPRRRAILAGGIGLTLLYLLIILRHPLNARIGDMASVLAIMGTWVGVELLRLPAGGRPLGIPGRTLVGTGLAAVLLVTAVSLSVFGNVGEPYRQLRALTRMGQVRNVVETYVASNELPWTRYWPAGEIPRVIDYLRQCTSPDDHLLVTWSAPHYYVFARRSFAAGIVLSLPGSFGDETTLERFNREHVPVVLINETTRLEFAEGYPALDRYITEHCETVGRYTARDESTIAIAIATGVAADEVYGAEAWPCPAAPVA